LAFLFNVSLEYAIRKVKKSIGIEWNTSAPDLRYYVNILSENKNTIKQKHRSSVRG